MTALDLGLDGNVDDHSNAAIAHVTARTATVVRFNACTIIVVFIFRSSIVQGGREQAISPRRAPIRRHVH